jgi:cardiolipin synthase A/B
MEFFGVVKLLPLYNREEEWEYRIRMINEAKQFIYASTYFLHHDNYGTQYTDALLSAHKRGVKVTLLIDGFGQILASSLMSRAEIKSLKKTLRIFSKNGINVAFYKCHRILQKLLGSGMHIKIQLSDSGGAIFSSGNISATSYDKWLEFAVYIEGGITQRLLEEFSSLGVYVDNDHKQFLQNLNLSKSSTQKLGYISYNPTLDTHIFNPVKLKLPNTITDYLIDVFSKAKNNISLTSLYFKPEPSLLEAIVKAAKRGVKVEIFHSHKDALGVSIAPWTPSLHIYKKLMDAGVAIYENIGGEHSKIILIDNSIVIFGSYNLEYAAHDRLAESMMISEERNIISYISEIFENLKANVSNIRIEENSYSDLPKRLHFKLLLLKYFSRWI